MTIRQAQRADAAKLTRLLQRAYYTHLHADWHLPADWLGTPGFLLREENGQLVSCFAAGADPGPAAWIRVVALPRTGDPLGELQTYLSQLIPVLQLEELSELGWLLTQDWPAEWLLALGFGPEPTTWVETMVKMGLAAPATPPVPGLEIRPVLPDDFPTLAALERTAFAPLWRHSVAGLRAAHLQSMVFTVATLSGEPVGFQYSTRSQDGAHLARMTVSTAHQGQGIGSALLADLLDQLERLGIAMVSLNTQEDNIPSHYLYEKYGFQPAGFRLPVWTMPIPPSNS
ncbi:MAG: GNAT family N-acetyltransferase [Anaerolineales bacterium]|nr:GNAT family N-acetyltransferase [Anaerolineales bacterium]MCB0006134.1 GNAT family N-acetyltransferase [Anaerolineales bacterium]MCB0013093.1 GNAT family N-acetyltransferase [Anaerolineales bacterium]MCB0017432.1 GNAT family N-acetyltransferase [Anaerolineales bacterium]MCB0028310.1 GNAT family N-acetyltransferase [Anaerolineales bacterium]